MTDIVTFPKDRTAADRKRRSRARQRLQKQSAQGVTPVTAALPEPDRSSVTPPSMVQNAEPTVPRFRVFRAVRNKIGDQSHEERPGTDMATRHCGDLERATLHGDVEASEMPVSASSCPGPERLSLARRPSGSATRKLERFGSWEAFIRRHC